MKKKRTRRRKKKKLDIDAYAEAIFKDIAEYLGLDTLDIDEKIQHEIVKEVMHTIITSLSYKPKIDALIKRINRHRRIINMIIAVKMLESIRSPTPDQLEFIVTHGDRALIPEIPRLYRLAKDMNREDLIIMLKSLWEKYGRPSPIECPKCGFRAVMPDLTCYVCGNIVSEKYIREKLSFEEKFEEYVKNASLAELNDVMNLGFVLLSEIDIKSPRYRIEAWKQIYYPINLRQSDIEKIVEEMGKRKQEY